MPLATKLKVTCTYTLIVALFLVQSVAALDSDHVTMPPPTEIPEELKSYYTSLTLKPMDFLFWLPDCLWDGEKSAWLLFHIDSSLTLPPL